MPEHTFQEAKRRAVMSWERFYFMRLMKLTRGNVSHAARSVGLQRSALQRALRKHGLKSADFRRDHDVRTTQACLSGRRGVD
jgi:transcriptional regulator of acetoin/glycerol metabolism